MSGVWATGRAASRWREEVQGTGGFAAPGFCRSRSLPGACGFQTVVRRAPAPGQGPQPESLEARVLLLLKGEPKSRVELSRGPRSRPIIRSAAAPGQIYRELLDRIRGDPWSFQADWMHSERDLSWIAGCARTEALLHTPAGPGRPSPPRSPKISRRGGVWFRICCKRKYRKG